MVAKILKYFPEITAEQVAQFEQMGPLYTEWNSKINLVSRKDIDEIYTRHILHSLAIAKVIQFPSGASVLDVGTGGGFPGIPLAVLYPDVSFHLVDSIGKKIKVVNQVAEALDLKNVKGTIGRAEELKDKYDFVVSRAVTRLKPFYGWVKGKFNKQSAHEMKNGIFYLKGGDLKEELTESKLRYKLFKLPDYFEEEFFETKQVVYVPAQ